MRRGRRNNRGILLIGSYLVLSMFLVYSSTMMTRVTTHQQAAGQLADRLQARYLAQGSMEQLREDFYVYFTSDIHASRGSNVVVSLAWLDSLGVWLDAGQTGPAPVPAFNVEDSVQVTATDGVTGNGLLGNARVSVLPVPAGKGTAGGNTASGSAWIVSVACSVAMDPCPAAAVRRLTVEATATVGSVTKRIRSIYEVALGVSDVFRYAYFVNNYGWFDLGSDNRIFLRGEVRANGDLTLSGSTGRMYIDGDLYASQNPDLINPDTGLPAAGTITGDPNQTEDQVHYWASCTDGTCKADAARPTRQVTFPGQPAIGGTPKVLPTYLGWDSDNPDQVRYAEQATKQVPYLGDLQLYKDIAATQNGTLTYYDSDAGITKTLIEVYQGPDGAPGGGDDNDPIILIGTVSNPIRLNGPVVVPGDVIIKGIVSGVGTIYTGRNVHVVGETKYQDPPHWRRLERNQVTGRIARKGRGRKPYKPESNLGTVCNNGTYHGPAASVPPTCMN